MALIQHPLKMVYDDTGRLVEVILSAEDFLIYLRSIMAEADWETLPEHLQDAIDRMLIDEVRIEKETALDLDMVLADDENER
ncbi:MAG: hypothetical protein GWN00_27165 [Aliifodinibius sp.]|nr:hypothetical protein [Fodinibius sp.]NIV14512.1 hypothetical protein [Fodinibius sp.]NIY28351.1 hypothetical protein [Fodinibius sp.]